MKFKTWLAGWLLGFCISFGSVAGLVTAFDLPDVSLVGLGLSCLLVCALCAWLFSTKYGHRILLGLLGVLVAYCLFVGDLWQSLQALVYRLSLLYHSAYGWGVPDLSAQIQQWRLQPALGFLAILPAVCICWAVCRQKKLVLWLPLALIPLYPCFVVTDTLPDIWCFGLILTGSLVLVLTQSLRRLSHRQGNRITAFALIPAILLSAVLAGSLPPEGYWEESSLLQTLVEFLPFLGDGEGDGNGQNNLFAVPGMPESNREMLTEVGPQKGGSDPVMKVRSGFGGFLYLRYQSFDTYSGIQWSNSQAAEDGAFWPVETELDPLGSVSITTEKSYEGLFIPYYSRNGSYLLLENGMLPNTEALSQYRFSVGQLQASYPSKTPDLSVYLALPKDTREAALKILQKHDLQTPEQILQYVKNSAAYDLNTQHMPVGLQDFALWFLESSDTGYCIHFATAAAVLLRAAGYPARYVTGYALMTKRGIPKTVTENMAHAWVEYADPETGYFWQVLEATPGMGVSEPTPLPTTQPTQPTTQPTQPTQSTQSPTTSAPTGPTETTPSGTVSKPATAPSATAPAATVEEPVDLSLLWTGLRHVGILIAAAFVLWGQYTIRFRLRLKKQRIGAPNAQALARWREIHLLGRLLKAEPPENLLELAEKARFSQHILTKDELFQMELYLQRQRKAILKLPLWKRFFLRLIWAI